MISSTEKGEKVPPPVPSKRHDRRGRRPRNDKAMSASQSSRPTFFIALRFHPGALTEAFRSAQQQLASLCPAVSTKGLIPEPKMHITLGLLHLDRRNKELIARTVDVLRDRCDSLRIRSLFFHGLGYFHEGGKEGNKRVAYLEPSDDENLSGIHEFSRWLCDELNVVVSEGEAPRVRVQDVLHLTVWKDKPVLPAAIAESLSTIEPFSAEVMSVELMEIGSTDSGSGGYRSYGGATF